jgi:hypothetical protein
MATLCWAAGAAIFGIICYALYQRREVKVGLKIPFVNFSFEAKDHDERSSAKANNNSEIV